MRAAALSLIGLLAVLAARPASAAEVGAAPSPEKPAPERPFPWLATGAAVVPGVLLHGAGHFAAGDRRAAYRLLALEGIGLAGLVSGIGVLAATGGSEKLAPLYVPLAVGGLGLFATSFIADLAGTVHGAAGPWSPPVVPRTLALQAGYVGLFGSPHTFSQLARAGAEWTGERWSAAARLVVHPRHDYAEYGAGIGWRLLAPVDPADPVTRLTLRADLSHQDFRAERFSMSTGRALAELRWNLGYLVETMRNAWLLGRLGWGFDRIAYRGPVGTADGLPFLVADLGIGWTMSSRVLIEAAYRHRKGELPGGLLVAGGLAGFVGMLELQGRIVIDRRWSLLPGVRVGNGVLTWLLLESSLF